MTTKPTTLREFVERSSTIAETIFAVTGRMHPMYHVVSPSGEDLIAAPRTGKDAATATMRELLRMMEATRVLLIDEAWVVHVRVPDVVEPTGSLEHHPDRTEQIIFVAEDAVEGTLLASREIRRDGDRATLEPLVFSDTSSFGGRMVGMLPTKGRAN